MTVQHVGLECADFDAEVAFWALLGFEEVTPPVSLVSRTRWLQRDGTQIHLLFADAPSTAGHVAVVVDDYERVREELGGEPRREYWGAPRTQVRSPAGHLVELMASPPPSS